MADLAQVAILEETEDEGVAVGGRELVHRRVQMFGDHAGAGFIDVHGGGEVFALTARKARCRAV